MRNVINHRRIRAQQLLGHVMHVLDRHIPDKARRAVADELGELFHIAGAYVVTDADRAAAGLSMRGSDGLTLDELHILEAKMLVAAMTPNQPIVMSPEGLEMGPTEIWNHGHLIYRDPPHIKITRPGTYRVTQEGGKLICQTLIDDGPMVDNRPPPPGS